MIKKTWHIAKETFTNFIEKSAKAQCSTRVLYYFLFAGIINNNHLDQQTFLGDNQVEESVYAQIRGFVGDDAAIQVQETIKNAAISSDNYLATIIGVLTLLIGATSVFSEMQDSINNIWNLKAKPKKGKGLFKLVLTRLLSFSMVVSLGFLLLVALIGSSVIDIFMNQITARFPAMTVVLTYIVNLGLTLLITSALFAIIFKVLPDAHIKWRDVAIGALVTAGLFVIGKYLIGLYLGQNKMSSAYGAAGSVVLILLWVYYSSMILYMGAVFTHIYAMARGRAIRPNKYAVFVQEIEVESKKSVANQPVSKKVVKSPEKRE